MTKNQAPSMHTGDQLADLELRTPDGDAVRLSEIISRRTVIPIVRYYGCMPCRDFLHQLESVRSDLSEANVDIVGVGKAADFQAAHLLENGIGYPLLMDPEELLYQAVGLGRFPWWKPLSPKTWSKYVRSANRSKSTSCPSNSGPSTQANRVMPPTSTRQPPHMPVPSTMTGLSETMVFTP